jgi:cytochrome P450 family 9
MFLKLIGFFAAPWLMNIFKVKFLDSELYDFFDTVITDTINTRESKKISRNDMIDLLLQAKHGQLAHEKEEETEKGEGFAVVEESQLGKEKVKTKFSNQDLMAQCFIFFFAGFETVSNVMTFMVYELIRNPEVQKKLQAEVDKMNKSLNGGNLSYETVQKMKYMDMVLCETLRMWPPAPIIDRMCTKDFVLEYDDKTLEFEVGKNFYIPVYSLHHNEKYFPNPKRFDPERFSDENKKNIRQDCYLPFGIGPR